MHWKRLDKSHPSDGATCVVGHFVPGNPRPIMGMWQYCYYGEDSYWKTKYGGKVYCGQYDNWCDVEDIIDVIRARIEDEIESLTD